MSPAVENTLERLDDLRQGWWLRGLVGNVSLVAAGAALALMLCVLADVLWVLPGAALATLFLVWAVGTLTALGAVALRAMRRQRGLAAAARRVEMAYPELESHLINLVQMAHHGDAMPAEFRAAALQECVQRAQSVDWRDAAQRHTRWQRWRLGLQTPRDVGEAAGVLAVLALLGFVGHLVFPTWDSALARVLAPWRFVPQQGAVVILEVTPGDADVLLGAPLEIAARVATDHPAGDAAQPAKEGEASDGATPEVAAPGGDTPGGDTPKKRVPEGVVHIESEDGAAVSHPLFADAAGGRYAFNLPAVLGPLRYRLQIGDTQSRRYAVRVRAHPSVKEVEITYEYPGYLNQPPRVTRQPHADLAGPRYSTARVKVFSSGRLKEGFVLAAEGRLQGQVEGDRDVLLARVPLNQAGGFTIHLVDEFGHAEPNPRVNTITVTDDAPPTVQLVKPAGEPAVPPGGQVAFAVRAQDDHGLGEVWLEYKIVEPEKPLASDDPAAAGGESFVAAQPAGEKTPPAAKPPAVEKTPAASKPPAADNAPPASKTPPASNAPNVLFKWEKLTAAAGVFTHDFTVDSARFRPGQALLARAAAADRRRVNTGLTRLEPQVAYTDWRRIKIVDPAAQSAADLARWEGTQARLWALLQLQLRARLKTAELAKVADPAPVAPGVEEVRGQQVRLQNDADDLAQTLAVDADKWEALVKRELRALSGGDLLLAVQQVDGLARARAPPPPPSFPKGSPRSAARKIA